MRKKNSNGAHTPISVNLQKERGTSESYPMGWERRVKTSPEPAVLRVLAEGL
jgi:hypothetical protein